MLYLSSLECKNFVKLKETQFFYLLIKLRSRLRIEVRPTENDLTGCTKMAIYQLLLRVASSNLVGRTSKWYFIIKFSLLLSIVLCWREIRPDACKTTENEFVARFL